MVMPGSNALHSNYVLYFDWCFQIDVPITVSFPNGICTVSNCSDSYDKGGHTRYLHFSIHTGCFGLN